MVKGSQTYKMHASAWINLRYLLLENFGTIDGTRSGWDTSDENFCPVGLKDLLDAAPMSHLDGSNGWADCEGIKPEEAMAEHDGIFRRAIYESMLDRAFERVKGEFTFTMNGILLFFDSRTSVLLV
jgi:hypothetical protein